MAKVADPNVTLNDMLEMVRRAKIRLTGKSLTQEQAEHLWLAELVEAIHEHIKDGGDFPRDWKPF